MLLTTLQAEHGTREVDNGGPQHRFRGLAARVTIGRPLAPTEEAYSRLATALTASPASFGSTLQTSGSWSAPATIVPGGPDYDFPYFNGQKLYFSDGSSGSFHIDVCNYNSSTDTFSAPQVITSIDGPAGTNSMFAWVSQNGTEMILDRENAGQTASDLYSAHWNGSSWTNVTELLPLHEDLCNRVPCVAENAGEVVYNSAPSESSPQAITIWAAPVTIPGVTSFGLTWSGSTSNSWSLATGDANWAGTWGSLVSRTARL